MKILLDTHIMLWTMTDDEQLPQKARELIENEDRFYFFKYCGDFEKVAKKFIEDDPDEYYVSDSLENYLDYEQFGEDMDRDHDGKFVGGGYVCMANGERLEDVLGRREQAVHISM